MRLGTYDIQLRIYQRHIKDKGLPLMLMHIQSSVMLW